MVIISSTVSSHHGQDPPVRVEVSTLYRNRWLIFHFGTDTSNYLFKPETRVWVTGLIYLFSMQTRFGIWNFEEHMNLVPAWNISPPCEKTMILKQILPFVWHGNNVMGINGVVVGVMDGCLYQPSTLLTLVEHPALPGSIWLSFFKSLPCSTVTDGFPNIK